MVAFERQQIGLPGDGVDQLHHVADPGRRLGQLADAVVGPLRLLHRLAGDARRTLDLTADLVDRRRHLLGGRRDRLHVGGGFFGGRRNRGGQLLRTLRGRRQRAGGGFQFGRGRGHDLDDLADHRLEVAGDPVDALAALDLGVGFHRGRRVGRLLGDQGVLEDLQRTRHGADFIVRVRWSAR